MGKSDWIYDTDPPDVYGGATLDPQDGGEPFVTWWEDMRPRETRELVKEVYERGRQSVLDEVKACIEEMRDGEWDDAPDWETYSAEFAWRLGIELEDG